MGEASGGTAKLNQKSLTRVLAEEANTVRDPPEVYILFPTQTRNGDSTFHCPCDER
jgi:hypothetical protein